MAKREPEVRLDVFQSSAGWWDFRLVGKNLGVGMRDWYPRPNPPWKTERGARRAGEKVIAALKRAKFVL